MSVAPSDAVAWHDEIAERFSEGYHRSPGFVERKAVWTGLIERNVGPGDAVLDAGCGAGTFSVLAATRAASVTAIDGSPAMIAIGEREAKRLGVTNATFEVAMLRTLDDRPEARFDIVLSSSVLEYVDDLEDEIARLARMLRPGGKLIVSMPNADSPYRKIERTAFRWIGRPRYYAHVRTVPTVSAMTSTLALSGLHAIETVYFADPPGLAAHLLGRADRAKTMFAIVARKR